MSLSFVTRVGMNAHKNSIRMAALLPYWASPVGWRGNTAVVEAIRRLGRRLHRLGPGGAPCCDESGPTGYALQRQLRAALTGSP